MADELLKKPLRVSYPASDDVLPQYTNQLAVQFVGHAFVLSFYAAIPPLLDGTAEERLEQAKQIEEVAAKCVARIIVPTDRMEDYLAAMQQNFDKVVRGGIIKGGKQDG